MLIRSTNVAFAYNVIWLCVRCGLEITKVQSSTMLKESIKAQPITKATMTQNQCYAFVP